MEQVSIAAAIPLVLLAPATTWSAAGTTSSSWLDIRNASAAPGEYNPGWHSSRTCTGNPRILQDEPISGLPCVSLQRVPGFWESAGWETAIQAPSFPLHVASLNLLLMGPHSEVRSGRRNLCVRSYFHLTKHLGLLQTRNCSFYLLSIASSLHPPSSGGACRQRPFGNGTTHRLTAWIEGTLAAGSLREVRERQ